MPGPRIAILGFSIECNRFAPPARRADFDGRCYLEGADILAEAAKPAPRAPAELSGFLDGMNATGDWTPLPIMIAAAEPNGPVDQGDFDAMMATWRAGLTALRGQADGVYSIMHGAGLAEHDHDPEGTLQALVREILGDIPFVCSYDLHANVSDRMVATVDAFVGYRTNPHLDMRERGAESAQLLRRLLAGERFHRAHRRLPIVSPQTALLTAQGPYAEVIELGQDLAAKDPRIANVSVMAGFSYGDTPFNGLSVIVTSTDRDAGEALAQALAEAAWERRARFVANLTSLDESVRLAKVSPVPLAFADVADNPGGGGRGNTMWILDAFHRAGVQDAIIGIIADAPLAAEAHALGVGARFTARFNRAVAADDPFSKPFEAEAEIRALSDGKVTGRRGIFAGRTVLLGRTAWLQIGGIAVVVIEGRTQCADPVFLEHLGLDIGKARAVVVKSRGHFRGGFDEFFAHEQIIEVDCPGLTSPNLASFPWKHLPRPVLPMDPQARWP
jgi:microcystin degradation protein MlrC